MRGVLMMWNFRQEQKRVHEVSRRRGLSYGETLIAVGRDYRCGVTSTERLDKTGACHPET